MARRKPLQKSVESCLALLAFLLLPRLPRRLLVLLSHAAGRIAFALSRRDRNAALANLEAVFGDSMTVKERRAMAIESFRTMALVALDLFWFGVDSERRIRKHVKCDEATVNFFTKGARIAVAAHFGNWEILGQAGSLLCEPCSSVAAPLRNPLVDKVVCRMRQVTGQKVVERKGAVRSLLGLLKEGKTIALLNDQNTLPIDGGIFVDFFGLPVPVSKAVAGLYLKVSSKLAFVHAVADRKGDYTIVTRPLTCSGEQCESVPEVTQKIVKMVEDAIREDPGKWMWMYKRWKFIPVGRSFEGFPGYARPIEPFELKSVT